MAAGLGNVIVRSSCHDVIVGYVMFLPLIHILEWGGGVE